MIRDFYAVFQSLNNERQLFYIVGVCWIFYIFYMSNPTFALLLAVVVGGWMLSGDAGMMEAIGDLENEKLDFLNGLLYLDSYNLVGEDYQVKPPGIDGSYLNKDSDLIDLFYQFRDYANYNLPSYRMALVQSNALLGIEEFISGTDYCKKKPHEWVEHAEMTFREVMNQIHTFVYSLPTTRVQNYLKERFSKSVELVLMQHFDNIKNWAKKKFDNSEINIESSPIHDYYARPNDTGSKEYSRHYSIY